MSGRVAGKVAFITGAARSQGRSHAIRLAQEGADIIAVDIAGPVDSVTAYPMATEEDLAETVKEVEALDRRIVARKADVRDPAGAQGRPRRRRRAAGQAGHRVRQRRHLPDPAEPGARRQGLAGDDRH